MKRRLQIKHLLFNQQQQPPTDKSKLILDLTSTASQQWVLRGSKMTKKNTPLNKKRIIKTQANSLMGSTVNGDSLPIHAIVDGNISQMQRRSLTQKKWQHQLSGNNLNNRFTNTRYSQRRSPPVQSNKTFTPAIDQSKQDLHLNFLPKQQNPRIRMRISVPSKQLSSFKHEIMKRISSKINMIKKMSTSNNRKGSKIDPTVSQSSNVFQLQKLYQHCLKKIKKRMNVYQKDKQITKDNKYYQLKLQSQILTREFREMRIQKHTHKNMPDPQMQACMGVVGNNIDIRSVEKIDSIRNSRRPVTSSNGGWSKKHRRERKESNPFARVEEGWVVSQMADDFLL